MSTGVLLDYSFGLSVLVGILTIAYLIGANTGPDFTNSLKSFNFLHRAALVLLVGTSALGILFLSLHHLKAPDLGSLSSPLVHVHRPPALLQLVVEDTKTKDPLEIAPDNFTTKARPVNLVTDQNTSPEMNNFKSKYEKRTETDSSSVQLTGATWYETLRRAVEYGAGAALALLLFKEVGNNFEYCLDLASLGSPHEIDLSDLKLRMQEVLYSVDLMNTYVPEAYYSPLTIATRTAQLFFLVPDKVTFLADSLKKVDENAWWHFNSSTARYSLLASRALSFQEAAQMYHSSLLDLKEFQQVQLDKGTWVVKRRKPKLSQNSGTQELQQMKHDVVKKLSLFSNVITSKVNIMRHALKMMQIMEEDAVTAGSVYTTHLNTLRELQTAVKYLVLADPITKDELDYEVDAAIPEQHAREKSTLLNSEIESVELQADLSTRLKVLDLKFESKLETLSDRVQFSTLTKQYIGMIDRMIGFRGIVISRSCLDEYYSSIGKYATKFVEDKDLDRSKLYFKESQLLRKTFNESYELQVKKLVASLNHASGRFTDLQDLEKRVLRARGYSVYPPIYKNPPGWEGCAAQMVEEDSTVDLVPQGSESLRKFLSYVTWFKEKWFKCCLRFSSCWDKFTCSCSEAIKSVGPIEDTEAAETLAVLERRSVTAHSEHKTGGTTNETVEGERTLKIRPLSAKVCEGLQRIIQICEPTCSKSCPYPICRRTMKLLRTFQKIKRVKAARKTLEIKGKEQLVQLQNQEKRNNLIRFKNYLYYKKLASLNYVTLLKVENQLALKEYKRVYQSVVNSVETRIKEFSVEPFTVPFTKDTPCASSEELVQAKVLKQYTELAGVPGIETNPVYKEVPLRIYKTQVSKQIVEEGSLPNLYWVSLPQEMSLENMNLEQVERELEKNETALVIDYKLPYLHPSLKDAIKELI